MLRSGTILMIREKAESGESAYAIGRELGISKNTAHKYIERKEDAPVKIDRFSKLDAYKPQLDELMNQGIFNCVVLLESLPCGVTRPRQASRRRWIGASAITRTAAERYTRYRRS